MLLILIVHLILGLLGDASLYKTLTMISFKVFIIFLVSAPIVIGARDRVATDTGLLVVDPPVIIGGPCETNPCLNNGSCVTASLTDSGYFCRCTIGFYGANCTESDAALTSKLIHVGENDLEALPATFEAGTEVDPICAANPCQNTGKCIPDMNVDSGYVCFCSMGWTGQNCEEKVKGSTHHLRALSTKDENPESRSLQSGYTQWTCLKNGYAISAVSIWFGHKNSDATWACNNWISYCAGQCAASANKVTESNWYCYGVDPMIYVGQAKISWGHSKGDATWACNSWNAYCKKSISL